jgi:hypothetical protein
MSGLMSERGDRWLPAEPVRTLDAAAAFVEDVGIALLFPADRPIAPSLWEAIAGPDAEPFAEGMNDDETLAWEFKDELPAAGLAWSGKLLQGRNTLLAPRLLASLYPGAGYPDDHQALHLSQEAHRIAEALLFGPLPTSALRELVGHKGPYDRAIKELHRNLLVTSAGTSRQGSGWPAVVVDLTCRRFAVGGTLNHRYAATRYLETMIGVGPGELARAYGWPAAAARAQLEALVADGLAVHTDGVYRVTA